MAKNYFLAKSDPDTYSLEDLEKDKTTTWDGVHNFQAINVIKKMKKGDLIYVYHSQTEKAVVGLMEAISEPFENTKDPRKSRAIDVKFVKRFKNPVKLEEFKAVDWMKDFHLVSHSRLSVMEVPEKVHEWIEKRVK